MAAISVAVLMLPCAALSSALAQQGQSVPAGSSQQGTQSAAPIVRRPPTMQGGVGQAGAAASEASHRTNAAGQTASGQQGLVPIKPKILNGPAPLAVKHTPQASPATTSTGQGANVVQAPAQSAPIARPPVPVAIPSSSFARPNLPAPSSQSVTQSTSPSSSATVAAPRPHPYVPRPMGPLVPSTPGAFNRTTVFIDAAHGGNDVGSRITDSILEKDVTLQLAFRLRSLLTARGFTVNLSREDDSSTVANAPTTPLSLDARAGLANHARPVACLLLHATGSGRGVHLYSSELTPTLGEANGAAWLTAQAPWVMQSWKLSQQMGQAITHTEIPLVQSRASIRPLDSLTCPALVVELAPDTNDDSSLANGTYQQRVASAIASALVFWQTAAQPPPRLLPAPVALTPALPMGTAPTLPASKPATQVVPKVGATKP